MRYVRLVDRIYFITLIPSARIYLEKIARGPLLLSFPFSLALDFGTTLDCWLVDSTNDKSPQY